MMPNRTIFLDDIADAIRLDMKSKGVVFSQWVSQQLRTSADVIPADGEPVKPAPPKNHACRHCKVVGDHWSPDCPFEVKS